jgi:hypothetical protein
MCFSSIFLRFLIFLHLSHRLLLCYLLTHAAPTYVTPHIRLNTTNSIAVRVKIQYTGILDTLEAHGPNICQPTCRKYLKKIYDIPEHKNGKSVAGSSTQTELMKV